MDRIYDLMRRVTFHPKIYSNLIMKDGNMSKYEVRLGKEYVENGFDIFKHVGRDYGFTPIKVKDNIVPSLQYAIDNATLVFYPGTAHIVTDVTEYIPDVWPDDSSIIIGFDDGKILRKFMKLYIDEMPVIDFIHTEKEGCDEFK